MSNEPPNKHSQAHRIWRRKEAEHNMAPSPEVEGDVQPGGGDPELKGSDPEVEEEVITSEDVGEMPDDILSSDK